MPRLRYDGPGRRLEAFGKTLLVGESDDFSNAEARSLAAQPHIHLTRVQPAKPDAPDDNKPPTGGEPEAHTGEGQPPNQAPEEEKKQ